MKLACVFSGSPKSIAHYEMLSKNCRWVSPEMADVIIVLGGDGFLLQSIHKFSNLHKPIYGMNSGTVGFLLNQFDTENLIERLKLAVPEQISPLVAEVTTADGKQHSQVAFNEIAIIRQGGQTASINIKINAKERLTRLDGDGILISTPMGSTAYNASAGGAILPINSSLLALTPMNAFRPRSWSGALLPNSVEVEIEALQKEKRPVSSAADGVEINNVVKVKIAVAFDRKATLLFDVGHSLEDRIIKEQFEA